jgi:hypothetical protein
VLSKEEFIEMKRVSLINTAYRLQAERLKNRGLIPGGGGDYIFATAPKAAVESAELSIQFHSGRSFPGG